MDAVRDRHLAYFTAYAEQHGSLSHGRSRLVEHAVEPDNLRAALDHAIERARATRDPRDVDVGFRLAVAMLWFWQYNARYEGVAALTALLDLPAASPVYRGLALQGSGFSTCTTRRRSHGPPRGRAWRSSTARGTRTARPCRSSSSPGRRSTAAMWRRPRARRGGGDVLRDDDNPGMRAQLHYVTALLDLGEGAFERSIEQWHLALEEFVRAGDLIIGSACTPTSASPGARRAGSTRPVRARGRHAGRRRVDARRRRSRWCTWPTPCSTSARTARRWPAAAPRRRRLPARRTRAARPGRRRGRGRPRCRRRRGAAVREPSVRSRCSSDRESPGPRPPARPPGHGPPGVLVHRHPNEAGEDCVYERLHHVLLAMPGRRGDQARWFYGGRAGHDRGREATRPRPGRRVVFRAAASSRTSGSRPTSARRPADPRSPWTTWTMSRAACGRGQEATWYYEFPGYRPTTRRRPLREPSRVHGSRSCTRSQLACGETPTITQGTQVDLQLRVVSWPKRSAGSAEGRRVR